MAKLTDAFARYKFKCWRFERQVLRQDNQTLIGSCLHSSQIAACRVSGELCLNDARQARAFFTSSLSERIRKIICIIFYKTTTFISHVLRSLLCYVPNLKLISQTFFICLDITPKISIGWHLNSWFYFIFLNIFFCHKCIHSAHIFSEVYCIVLLISILFVYILKWTFFFYNGDSNCLHQCHSSDNSLCGVQTTPTIVFNRLPITSVDLHLITQSISAENPSFQIL